MKPDIPEIRESWEGAELIRMMEMSYGDPLPRSTKVGSADWFRWLHLPDTESFKFFPFLDDQLDFSVRREIRQAGDIYFTAYKRISGKLRKVYLGKPSAVTLEKLHEAGKRFKSFSEGVTPPPRTVVYNDVSEIQPYTTKELILSKEVDRLKSELDSAKQTIETQESMLSLYDDFNADLLLEVGEIVEQWNERAKGKKSKVDRTWQMALHLLHDLKAALKIDSPGSAEEQPAEGGN